MKKNTLILFTLLISAAYIISCGGKNEKSGTPEKVNLAYKFSKGDKFKYKLSTISTSEESIQADSSVQVNNKQTDTYITEFEVIDVDADKIAELNVNFASIKLEAQSSNGEKMVFDTDKNPSKEDQQKYWQYAMQYSVPFRLRINPQGEVIEISRLDKMIDKMNSLQKEKRELTAPERSKLTQDLSESIIRPLAQLIFRELPKKNLSIDSTWKKNYPGQLSVFKIENTAIFKLEGIQKANGDNAAKIGVNLSVTWQGEKQGQQQGIKYNFDDPKITGSGSILFNIDKGMLIKSETSTTVNLTARIEGKNAQQKIVRTVRRDVSTNKNIVELIQE